MSKSLKKLIDINRLREFKNKLVGTDSAYVQTTAVDQTVAGTKTFSKPIVGSVTGSSGSCTGNAATATKAVSADSATNASHATSADSAANADHATNADSATRATSADSASVADCVQSQTSAYHEIKFDWDSQVPGYVGLRVDASDMGGIVTTNRLVSDIRAQWYAAFPDGAEAHNAMWGGRDITAAFDAGTVSEHIADGTFRDIFPGDYITKQVTIPRVLADDGTTELFAGGTSTVTWVIADCDYWINKGDGNMATTAHHVVIVPQAPIFAAQMNAANTTEGGYAGSEMYRNVIPACATGIVSAFGSDHILMFRDCATNNMNASATSPGLSGWFTGVAQGVAWASMQCNLMSEGMVYGNSIWSSSGDDNCIGLRQMSAFRLSEKAINYNRQWYWLRNVVSSTDFAGVNGYGYASTGPASTVVGVRPFALLV